MIPVARSTALPALVLALLLVAPPAGAAPSRVREELALKPVARGLDQPVWLTAPAGDPRLFVLEQPGRIRIIANGRLLARPFLDLTDRVRSGGERGLLGMAFHPRYAENGRLYVNYTDPRGDTRIERYTVTRDPGVADPATASLVLHVRQPYANHNGGQVTFGPDGMLWIGMGDGGSAGDPFNNAQNPASLLGKMLRIDVDRGEPYAIPPDNPFGGRPGARPEIWASGLRNPWRFCFDAASRSVVIGDVGQNAWEEIDIAPVATPGLDYGWNRFEGRHRYRPGATLAAPVPPAVEYPHGEGCSVIGGFVYRGRAAPALRGFYLYSDYCRGWLRGFRIAGGRAVEEREWLMPSPGAVTSFGEDGLGELYLLTAEGEVLRIAAARDRAR